MRRTRRACRCGSSRAGRPARRRAPAWRASALHTERDLLRVIARMTVLWAIPVELGTRCVLPLPSRVQDGTLSAHPLFTCIHWLCALSLPLASCRCVLDSVGFGWAVAAGWRVAHRSSRGALRSRSRRRRACGSPTTRSAAAASQPPPWRCPCGRGQLLQPPHRAGFLEGGGSPERRSCGAGSSTAVPA
eukprot:SAG31_NODE_1877_length_7007_cov_3.257093_4_plen_189_part_00